jgi:Tol biopolymer transport system component
VRDPAVSPDGKWVAFIIRHPNYSDLAIMPSNGGEIRIVLSGNGQFEANPGFAPKSTHNWYAQPSWAEDSKHLLFLSDLAKSTQGPGPGINAFLLDLQVFEISIENPKASLQAIAYANYGDGGNRDASYRPHHPDQVIYTHYAYDTSNTKQLIQLFLEDANAITNNPGKYRPGATGYEFDPAVALTPATPDLANLQPAFSPDGNAIAYVRRLDATRMGIFVMPVAENVTQNPNDPAVVKKALAPYGKSTLLVSGQYIGQPTWSPDGTKLAYIGYNNNVFDLWMANLSKNAKSVKYSLKGSAIQLTDTGGHLDADSRPFWTP